MNTLHTATFHGLDDTRTAEDYANPFAAMFALSDAARELGWLLTVDTTDADGAVGDIRNLDNVLIGYWFVTTHGAK